MKYSILIVVVILAVVAALGVGIWWYRGKSSESEAPMISLVALLSEPVVFDQAVLAKTAGRVWNADLGDGHGEGVDGFVAGVGAINTIKHGDRLYLINCIPRPYVDDPQQVAESIADLRIRKAFGEHRAWFSCDVLTGDEALTAAEIADGYQRLAKLFAELLDERCLLIYLPETRVAYAINDETERALLSDDPVAALQATRTVPITMVSADDPRMAQAVAKARANWPQFVAAFEARSGEHFSVKAPISYADTTEFIWIEVTAVEGNQIYGTLGNEPADLGPLKLGSKVSTPLEELNDWCYVDPDGNFQGGFTVAVVQEAAGEQQEP